MGRRQIHITVGDVVLEDPYQLLWWILKTFCVPVTLPFILYKAYRAASRRTKRAQLQDKIVVITGASSGIGEAIAHKLYKEGCKLVLTARRLEELDRVKNDLLNTQANVSTHMPVVMYLDLSDTKCIENTVKNILDMHGRIDILINNAGISHRGLISDTTLDVYMKVMMVNYFSQIAITKAVLPYMVKRSYGHIIFTSSMQGKIALPCRSAYCASKHAIQAFGDALRSEVAKDNIKVCVLCPSYVKTSLSQNALTARGDTYGKTDKSTGKGFSPDVIAEDVIEAIISEKGEITRGPLHHHIVYCLRALFPSVYFKILSFLEKGMRKEMES